MNELTYRLEIEEYEEEDILQIEDGDIASIPSPTIETNFLNHNFEIKKENFTLIEKIDKVKLKIIIDNFEELLPKLGDFKPAEQNYKKLTDAQTIKTILENLYYRDDVINYNYSYGKKSGRMFGKNCLQSISRVVRHTVATGMTDIDIKNAHFIFLQHIAHTLNIPIPNIDRFIKDRDSLYKWFMTNLKMSKDEVKRVFLSSLNNGQCEDFYNTSLFKNNQNDKHVIFFTEFHEELKDIIYKISNYNDDFRGRFNSAIKDKERNPEGSFINLILCEIENKILHIICDCARNYDIEIATYCFDGFLCYNNNLPSNLTELFHEMENEVYSKLGIKITLTKKEMDEGLDLSNFISTQTEFEVNDKYVQLSHLENPSPIVLINAFMGFGKSTATIDYMKKHKYNKRIIITPRITYADAIKNRMDNELKDCLFNHYNNINGKIDMNIYKNIIVQFESLWRLENYLDDDVLVVIDEVESVLTQCVSKKTNKDRNGVKNKHTINLYTFSKLLSLKKVFCLDAFISTTLKKLLYNLNLKFVCYNYIAKKQQRIYSMINPPKKCQTEEAFCSLLIQKIKLGKKCFVFCSSKNLLTHLVSAFECLGLKHEKDFLKYSSSHKDSLNNVNELWSNVQIVISTSTITVGVNFDLDYFDNIFIFMSSICRNLVRDVFQWSYRIRTLKEKIYIGLYDNNRTTPKKYNINETIELQKKFNLEYGIETRIDDCWVNNLFKDKFHERVLSEHYMIDEFNSYLKKCNYVKEDFFFLENDFEHYDFKVLEQFNYEDIPIISKEDFKNLWRKKKKEELEIQKIQKFLFMENFNFIKRENVIELWGEYSKFGGASILFTVLREINNKLDFNDYYYKTNFFEDSFILTQDSQLLKNKYHKKLISILGCSTQNYGKIFNPEEIKHICKLYQREASNFKNVFDLRQTRGKNPSIIDNINMVLKKLGYSMLVKEERKRVMVKGVRLELATNYILKNTEDFDIRKLLESHEKIRLLK